ncbi:MAG TPA: Na+/H+ antiporter NhaC family protein [Ignavibacteriaceae bacterium]|nr:Na+/H+ antiporter NhaC family protein [Ignavibacteriaceae bacterium]
MRIILLFLLLTGLCFPQQINTSSIVLEDISFSFKVTGLPDSIHLIDAGFNHGKFTKNFQFKVRDGKIDTLVSLENPGDYTILLAGTRQQKTSIRVLPGILSILPPLIAILLALIFRQVVVSLLFGIYLGAIFIYDYNPLTAFLRLIDSYIINAVSDTSHIQIIVFTLLFGGVIGLISKSGGTKGIANLVTRFAKTRRSSLIATWFSGIVIFFDDYANSLVIGNLMRPVTDKMRISREKLSFYVDATAAPVTSIFIVSSWIGYEVGLIQNGLKAVGSTENAYDIFLKTIPYRFYPILMIIFVFFTAIFQRDFGPMFKAEKRAVEEGKPNRDNANISKDLTDSSEIFGHEEKAKWYNGIIPIAIIVIGTIIGLIYTGIDSLSQQGITEYSIGDIVGKSNSYLALLWGSASACLVAAVMILLQKIMTLQETMDAWFLGLRSMFLAVIILTLAWSIGNITQDMKTADYIISIISDTINPRLLPVLVFLVCALISFATGTSWGTMAIMMPIVIPLSHSVSILHNYNPTDYDIILHGVISSVLAGSVFGDHCSPISDTTILSSMASGCDHIEHVRTQLPYAVVTAIFCMLLGDIPTAYGFSPYLSIAIISAVLMGILFFFGKSVSYTPLENNVDKLKLTKVK